MRTRPIAKAVQVEMILIDRWNAMISLPFPACVIIAWVEQKEKLPSWQ